MRLSRVPEATAGQGAPQGQGEHCGYQAGGTQTVQVVILLGSGSQGEEHWTWRVWGFRK